MRNFLLLSWYMRKIKMYDLYFVIYGDFIFDSEGFYKTERKLSNYKPSSTTVPAFVFNTPSGSRIQMY
ncbi:hypothetical protein [Bacillus wiedmannii]|uniref:hypothetical protein n=1 Tax=Bacillus wiedmannii TaxID=1890302 RepID=UPI00065C07EB|nr:hypothetical protein [Bacillus wiedmannii]KMP28124.1 hypothetical protein TU50_13115 [Bacillus wiedmannii]